MHVEAFRDGDFLSAVVLVDGERLDPCTSQDVWITRRTDPRGVQRELTCPAGPRAASPGRPAWPDVAVRLHQQFKREFIVARPQDESWAFDMDVLAWARSKQAPDSGSG
jgi:hypothetical protein